MTSFALRYVKFAIKSPWLALCLIGLVTAAFASQVLNLKVDSTPYFIDNNHPERLEEAVVRAQFTGSKEQAYVLVVSNAAEKDVFNRSTLQTVQELTTKLEALSLVSEEDLAQLKTYAKNPQIQALVDKVIEGGVNRQDGERLNELKKLVLDGNADPKAAARMDDLILRATPIKKVRSLTNVESIESASGALEVSPLMAKFPGNDAEFAAFKKKTLGNPMYQNILLSPDSRATTVHIEFNIPDYDSINLVRANDAVLKIVDGVATQDALHFGGTPVVNAEIVKVLEHDNAVFFPGVIVVIGLVLWFSFKRTQGVFLPLVIAVMSVVWTLGTMTLLGIKQNVVTTAMPVFLITLGVCDAIHFLNTYFNQLAITNKTEALIHTTSKLTAPIFYTSLTNAIGFYGSTFTNLVFVRDFGLVMMIGVTYALVLTLVLLPPLLVLLKVKAPQAAKPALEVSAGKAAQSAGVFGRFFDGYRNTLAIFLLLVAAAAAFISTKITFDQHNTSSFNETTRLRKDDAVFNKHMGGTSPLNISFHATEAGAFTRPETILALDKISKHLLEKKEVIGYVNSPVEFLKRIHQVVGDDKQRYVLPANMSADMIAQYYLLYESSNSSGLRDVLDSSYTHARIAVLGRTDQASVWRDIIDETDAYIQTVLPKGITYKFSNVGNIQKANLNEVVAGQYSSLTASGLLIGITMIFVCRSLMLGLIAMVPLVCTLFMLFAFMTLAGISLDIGTSLIAGLVFGIGVDFAVHFFAVLKRAMGEAKGLDTQLSMDECLAKALNHVSRPILINALSLGGGFLVLSLSDFAPIKYLGLFIAGSMLLCAVLMLLVMPTIIWYSSKLKMLRVQKTVAAQAT
jgi:hypothetical protein